LEDFGLVQNIDFTFAYIPDFIKLGSALIDFQNPDFVLIGSRDSENALPGRYLWNSFVHSDTVCREVSVLEAEIVKICLNAYLVSKINFANFVNLALFNESGVNPRRILEIVGLDKRIGQSFLLPGTPYGGTCFPRDATAFQFWAKQLGLDAKHIAFSEAFNKDFEDFFVRELSKFKNVAILGFSFKEGTNVLTGSPSLKIAEQLVMKEVSLRIFDRFYNSYPRDILDKYFFCESVEDATKNVEAVLIMHNDPRLHPSADCQASIFDPWHITRSNF
jgi:UDPglucose 6-dehydrogenase